MLLAVELLQGVVGFVQYFTGLPAGVVELHLLGASLVAATASWTVLAVREGSHPRPGDADGSPRAEAAAVMEYRPSRH